MYVFDEMPMFFALAVFNIYHPGRVLVGPESEYPKRNSEQAPASSSRLKFWKRDAGMGKSSDRDGYVLSSADGRQQDVDTK
jgi:hypothetical protein